MSTNGLSVRVKGTKVQDLRRIELTFSRSKIRRVANRKPGNLLTIISGGETLEIRSNG